MAIGRRHFVQQLAAAAGSSGVACAAKTPAIGLGLGNYGLKGLTTAEALELIAGIGYDSVEFTLMPGYITEAINVPPAQRREIRLMVSGLGLAVPSLLEGIFFAGDGKQHKTNLERIRRDAQFGHDVSPGGPAPVVQTHLGDKDKDWDGLKNQIVGQLHDWGEVGREMKTVVAIKGHNLNLMDTAERRRWVMQKMTAPWLKLLCDYSHYEASGEYLGKTMDLLLPYTAIISIKDGKPNANGLGFERLLPGDGKVDYVDYYRRLIKFGYNGQTVVEISGQIHSRPGYDPVVTAKRCYRNVAPAMEKAGVHRPARKSKPA